MELEITSHPEQQAADFITGELRAHNRGFAQPDREALWVLLRKDEALVAGLQGHTHWGCFRIEILWVSEPHRSLGLGAQILTAALEEATRRGCRSAVVETMAFQARGFYEAQGFEVFGTVVGGASHLTCFFMKSALGTKSR